MQRTALYQKHIDLNARMQEFAGFLMPINYQSIQKEHITVRNNLGVFDVSHMGEFIIEGRDATDFLQYVCSNNISNMYPGRAQYNYFPNGKSGIVDDLIVYQLDFQKYLLVVNAANIEKDWLWVNKHASKFDVDLKNISNRTGLLAIQGPLALSAMQILTTLNLSDLRFYHHFTVEFAGCPEVIVATTGYTGSGGIEIYFPNEYAEIIWDEVLSAGKSYGIKPIGLAARDTLRLEMGYCLYGNELSETTSPIAAGLGWVTKPNTKCINHEFLSIEKSKPSEQKLLGLVLKDRGIPRKGYKVQSLQGEPIGTITSGAMSPVLGKGIGLAYLDREIEIGDLVGVLVRNKTLQAEVVKPPFVSV